MSNQNTQEKLTVTAVIDKPNVFTTENGQNIEYANITINLMGIDIVLKAKDATSRAIVLAYAKNHYKEEN